jgi:hypothetical protein
MGRWVERLQGLTSLAQLKVQVGTCGGSCHAHSTKLGCLLNPIPFANKRLLQMGVKSFNTFAVVNQHGHAVATDRLHQQHPASQSGQHWSARWSR